jgi:crotonobetainyl-CoA:carnitine CoA-transferase CaiB-like acyl-CoA transferase
MVLADWGAEVVKVESRSGDPTRQTFAGQPHLEGNPVFEFENRGKRGIVLDISKPAGRDALVAILKDADLFITNVRMRSLRRAKLDYDSLKDALPRLIYCSISGYGLEGPGADLPAFDIAAFWTRSGIAASGFPRGTEPFGNPGGMGDEFCALSTASAAMAAVIERGRTGQGRLVETSLLLSGVFANGWNTAIQLKYGKLSAVRPRTELFNPLSNYWPTKDGRWLVTVTRQGFDDLRHIAAAAGRPELADDARFASGKGRAANATALVEALDEGFAAVTLEEAGERLTAADVVWAPLQLPRDVVEDPFAHAAGCFTEVEDVSGARYMAPSSPARVRGGERVGPRRPAPALGQHTREVLSEAGYSEDEIESLIAEGAAA